jgi:hydroxymethylbilane synthase
MSNCIRIGTRQSPLAVCQAKYVQDYVESNGFETEIVFVKSEGDIDLVSPLYELGVQGIFTKQLDLALLKNTIDIAVHSLKDVPIMIPKGLKLACIPTRGNPSDTLVYNLNLPSLVGSYHIATSSLRRKSQWAHKYGTKHKIDSVRGNINTRLQKLQNSEEWDGMIFATAGLERIHLEVPNKTILDWMIPAPAQGALSVICRENDADIAKILMGLNCDSTTICVNAERTFLRLLEGGCKLPLGCLVTKNNDTLFLNSCLLDPEGEFRINYSSEFNISKIHQHIEKMVEEIKSNEIFPLIVQKIRV